MPESGEGRAREEWIRAHAQLIRAKAGEIEFGRFERACFLVSYLAFTAVSIWGLITTDGRLVTSGGLGVGVSRGLAWMVRGRARRDE